MVKEGRLVSLEDMIHSKFELLNKLFKLKIY